MKLNELIYENEYTESDIDLGTEVLGIATSPEEVEDGFIFILGNPKKMPEIKELPTLPLAILSSEDAEFPSCIPAIKVKNARLASSYIHSRFFKIDYSSLSIIGVTGTNGKTTTAYMIYNILCRQNIKSGFIGTGKIEINGEKISDTYYSMTTPDPKMLYNILRKMQDVGCEKIVMEVSSHALALDKVAPIPFEYAVFTNLSPEHTDFHNTMEDYFEAKLKLLKNARTKVINIDDSFGRLAAEKFKDSTLTAGVLWRGDYYVTNIENKEDFGLTYFTHSDKICYKTILNFPGIYNVYNSLLATAVCIDMGIAPCNVKKAFECFSGVCGRFELIKGKITVIIDYAHTEAAYENLLKELKKLKKNKKLTVVFGCGGERDRTKRAKIAALTELYADKIIVTEDNSRNEDSDTIFNDIEKGFCTRNYKITEDRAEAIQEAIAASSKGDFVAVIGKGAEEYNIDKNGYHPFNDKETALSVLKEYESRT